MQIELSSYITFAVICMAAIILFSIRKKIKAVIGLVITLLFLVYKIYGISQVYEIIEKTAPLIPKNLTEHQTEKSVGDNNGSGDIDVEIEGEKDFKLPKVKLPTLRYYDKGK